MNAAATATFPAVTRPLRVGTMELGHRIVVPPHSGGGGSVLGNEDQVERHAGYWLARIEGGVQWIGGGPTFVANPLIPGFEPTGVGASGAGMFRHPAFVEKLGRFHDRVHAAGGFASIQMVLQGGMPIAPSPTLSGYSEHRIPHALDLDEIAWLIREYGESGTLAAESGADAIELHANHDDVLQWFLSPLTNHRDDAYGGDFEHRRRLLREVVEAIRDRVERPITVGLRLCMDELIEGGYGLDECQRLLAAFTADGTVDYFSLDIGNNWGAPSYIPPAIYGEAEWAGMCGKAKEATDLPVVYVGIVTSIASAEAVLAGGQADLVGMARAHIADPGLVAKSLGGRVAEVRPCIGVNDCIHRRVVEGLPFGCATNPAAGREHEATKIGPAARSRSILVVGGGPAGLELAASAAERGHHVELWERSHALGGQLAIAARARMNHRYANWIEWQARRLERLGVAVRLEREATAPDVAGVGAEVVVVATGATPRRPLIDGIELPHVLGAAEVLTGTARPGGNVLVVAEDDRPAPLAVADHLAGAGHTVTVAYPSMAPSPLLGKYSIGALLARLDAEGVTMLSMTKVVGIDASGVHLANAYSGRRWRVEGFDSIVLACGAIADDGLFRELKGAVPEVHLLGDAYAPRRMVFATRQAWELAALL